MKIGPTYLALLRVCHSVSSTTYHNFSENNTLIRVQYFDLKRFYPGEILLS
jgi:hypothetical protein